MTPSRNDPVTIGCPVCGTAFVAAGKRRYCSDACRVAAHRRRHRRDPTTVVVVPDGRPRGESMVYECPSCEVRTVGNQRCGDCGTFMHRVGIGGLCPCCDEPIVIDELLGR